MDPCFFYGLTDGNLISGSSASLKPSLYIWKFFVTLTGLYFSLKMDLLQMDLYCHRMGKWVGLPLCLRLSSIFKSLRNQKNSPDLLNNPLLTPPNSQQINKLPPLLNVPLFLRILLIKLRPPPPQRDNPCWDNILSASLLSYQGQFGHYLV